MRRRLICGALGMFLLGSASYLATAAAFTDATPPPVLERFLAGNHLAPSYRALRHLEAHNDRREPTASMDVWTDADAFGFRYQIVAESGSGYIRSRVFAAALEAERKLWMSGDADRGAITPANYVFQDRGAEPSGLAWVGLKPRRKDFLLVDGSIFLRPEDGDLVRIQGALAKPPSFLVRRVEIVRRYERIGGVRLPVSLEAVASVLIAGKSRLSMTYRYETVNGQRVATD